MKTIYAYGGGGGGAAVNAYTQNIYPGGGGGSGFAVSADVTPDIKYISVSMGYGGPSDTKGGDTVLQLLSADKYVLKTLIAEGGMPGQLGYLNKYNIPYGGNGGAGYCGGGGGGMGQFPYHQPSIPGTGGMGVVSQNMGQSGNLGVPIESMLPSGGD
ncbi:MAG TPA: hypothetical protein PKD85_08640, partial [Saprospiraceae bacterium]|nr:hypothetical protein [Saprospiraceae bacterium]